MSLIAAYYIYISPKLGCFHQKNAIMKNNSRIVDEIDAKILNFLQQDAKLTARDLAEKISLTQTPVYERIRKLEKKGIIKQYVALLDTDLLGKTLLVFMNITVKEHNAKSRDQIVRELSSLKEISELYQTSGTYDFMAKVRFSDIKDYRDFLVNRIAAIDNINDIDSQIVLEEIKYTTSLPM